MSSPFTLFWNISSIQNIICVTPFLTLRKDSRNLLSLFNIDLLYTAYPVGLYISPIMFVCYEVNFLVITL